MAFPVSPTEGQTHTENNTVWIYSAVTGQWNRSVINPLNETTYIGSGGAPGGVGSNTQVIFNDNGSLAGDVDLTWNKTTNVLGVTGDVNLSDGGSFTTTLQTITPTANRTISLPNATGTVALVAGSSGQITYNNAGANAGVSSFTADSSGRLTNSASSAAGLPVKLWNGTIFAGTTPHVLVQPSTASAGSWSASGTALGVNTAAGFTGRLIDCQVNGSALFNVDNSAASETRIFTSLVSVAGNIRQTGGGFSINGNSVGVRDTGTFDFWSGVAASPSVIDLRLFRDAANTLAQRNGTNAQTFRVYNTFTDASNYERGFLRWSSNVFEVGPEAAGTGTTRPMRITAATLKLPNLPTYATNAAAITGGLVAGDVYKTATGELRITV